MREGDDESTPYIERDGRLWQVVFPARTDIEERMDLCTGPYLTRCGARLSLWFNNRLAKR